MNTTENNIKVFVPKYFSDKVKYICGKIPTVEWCGIVFYTVESSIKDVDNCKYILQDILPMSKDSGSATSYTTDDRVVDYLMQDDKRLDWKQGDIHSHHNLGSFFSGTDYKDLHHQANTSNVILSITVDNKNLYVGKVATKARAEIADIVYTARDEDGKTYPFTQQKQSLEITTIFNCVFEFEDSSVVVDDEFAANVERIIKEANTKAFTPTTQIPQYDYNYGKQTSRDNYYKQSVFQEEDEEELTMEEELFMTSLLNRNTRFTDTMYEAIKSFVHDKMPLKAKLALFRKNFLESLVTYTNVLEEKKELCEGVLDVIKENRISFPYVIDEIYKEMSNIKIEIENGRKF